MGCLSCGRGGGHHRFGGGVCPDHLGDPRKKPLGLSARRSPSRCWCLPPAMEICAAGCGRRGFALAADRPVQAAGRWYAVMAAEYTGQGRQPTLAQCLFGETGCWPEGATYAAWQRAKLPKLRLGVPDGTPLAAEMDAIIQEGDAL